MTGIVGTELEASVAQGVMRGDRASLAAAYETLAQNVMNLAMRILQNRSLAEEVLQDTFVDLLEKWQQIKSVDRIPAWVRSVATNHCLMKLRSPWMARQADVETDVVMDATRAESMSEELPTIEKALASLPVETRAVIWLHDVEGFTHKEIGELMGKTTSFSKSQLARGYERLLAWSQDREATTSAYEETETSKDKGGEPQHQDKHERKNDISASCSS